MIAGAGVGVLDLLGVLIFGLIGTLAVRGIQNINPSPRISEVLQLLSLDTLDFRVVVATLAISGTLFLIIKSMASIYFIRKQILFLNNATASISQNLTEIIFGDGLEVLRRLSSQDIRFMTSNGGRAITLGVLSSLATLISDSFLLVLMLVAIFVASPPVALVSTIVFTALAFLLHRKQQKSAFLFGGEVAKLERVVDQSITELIANYRSIFVSNTLKGKLSKIDLNYKQLSHANGKAAILPSTGKYLMELFLILSLLVVVAVQFTISDAARSIGVLSLFFVASARIAPAILRVQQSLLTIRANTNTVDFVFKFLNSLRSSGKSNLTLKKKARAFSTNEFIPSIELSQVSFSYEKDGLHALNDVSFRINPGERVALIGKSGTGKSTLVDLVLGLNIPTSGMISISDLPPRVAMATWPGKISYVPQEVFVSQGTLRDNLELTNSGERRSDEELWMVLDKVSLKERFLHIDLGLDLELGESHVMLSGGEKQRLGIARALCSHPSLLVLDEVTSALDLLTEKAILKTIFDRDERTTILIIAHKLSTIKAVDKVFLLEGGRILDSGTYEELQSRHIQLDKLVEKMSKN